MSNIITIPSIVLGIIVNLVYCIRRYNEGKEYETTVLANNFLLASGIVCGILLLFSSLVPSLHKVITDMNLYIAISGATVLNVSFSPLKKMLSTEHKAIPKEEKSQLASDA